MDKSANSKSVKPSKSTRKRSVSNVTAERRAQLNAGAPSANLTEMLAIDFALLMQTAVPEVGNAAIYAMQQAADSGITQRMALAGKLVHENLGAAGFDCLRTHSSDTVRGWACYLLAALPDLSLKERLQQIQPLADDAHFGVREWAWIALRPIMAADLSTALALLQPWTGETSERIRRFASESLRPRGVWCNHIAALKTNPALGLTLLEPLRTDTSVYVQDSVANWLNDASKDQPQWVRSVCTRWLGSGANAATQRICKRALRTIGAE